MSTRRFDKNSELKALGALTTTGFGAAVDMGQADRVIGRCRVQGAPTGTNPTLDLVIQQSPDGSTGWNTIGEFPQITAAGLYEEYCRPITQRYVREGHTLGGTTPSFNCEIGLAPG